jgi:hypothetical protein
MTDFTTASLLAGRVEGETYASAHYARVAKALADASELWKRLAVSQASGSADAPLLKAKAQQATTYALSISGK